MDRATLLRKLAEIWREAAAETPYPALRQCYAERAFRFETLAAKAEPRPRDGKPPPSVAPEA